MEYSLTGKIRERTGNRNPHFVPAEDFETADGKILVINAGTDSLWQKLAHTMGQPQLLEDPRFNNTVNRIMNQNELYEIIAQWVKGLTAEEGLAKLDQAGVPADIMRNIEDLATNPHMLEREAIVEVADPEKGKVLVPGVFPKMKNSPGQIQFLGAKLGEYNREIYEDFLGITPEELADLAQKGVV